MSTPRHPLLYQINTRVWLTAMARSLGRPATLDDIAGSGFAITAYDFHDGLGGDAALARLRARLGARGLRLLLDFVPNHTGMDHPWVQAHPEYYVPGTDEDLALAPQNYTQLQGALGGRVFA